MIAIDPVYRGQGGHIVRWFAPDRVYIDPSTGAHFDLYGRPVRWADRSLAHYPLKLEAGIISIDLSHPQVTRFPDG